MSSEIRVEYEETPGKWRVIDGEHYDPPRMVGELYDTQAEAEAYRAGYWDGLEYEALQEVMRRREYLEPDDEGLDDEVELREGFNA